MKSGYGWTFTNRVLNFSDCREGLLYFTAEKMNINLTLHLSSKSNYGRYATLLTINFLERSKLQLSQVPSPPIGLEFYHKY